MKTMRCLCPGQKGRITEISAQDALKMRLFDLGFSPEEEVLCLTESPLGDPKAYFVKGAVYAVRNNDAEKIQIYDER